MRPDRTAAQGRSRSPSRVAASLVTARPASNPAVGTSTKGSARPRSAHGSDGERFDAGSSSTADKSASRLWNGLIARWHYLGYQPLPGAQLRYLIRCEAGLLGAIGFGAAAWKVAARDAWIGWDRAGREAHLGRVLNNARFLILPWVQVKNLASKVLALAAARVVEDFPARYGEPLALLETLLATDSRWSDRSNSTAPSWSASASASSAFCSNSNSGRSA